MQIEELYNEGGPRMKLTQQLNHTVIMLADIVATQENKMVRSTFVTLTGLDSWNRLLEYAL